MSPCTVAKVVVEATLSLMALALASLILQRQAYDTLPFDDMRLL